jgi:hypothetical protein
MFEGRCWNKWVASNTNVITSAKLITLIQSANACATQRGENVRTTGVCWGGCRNKIIDEFAIDPSRDLPFKAIFCAVQKIKQSHCPIREFWVQLRY